MANDMNSRLSRLETIIESMSAAITEIKLSLSEKNKINWAPIAIGVTIFFTVCGSVATIYNARIATLNSAVEAIANRTLDLEKGSVASQIKTQTLDERVSNLEKNVDHLQENERHPKN